MINKNSCATVMCHLVYESWYVSFDCLIAIPPIHFFPVLFVERENLHSYPRSRRTETERILNGQTVKECVLNEANAFELRSTVRNALERVQNATERHVERVPNAAKTFRTTYSERVLSPFASTWDATSISVCGLFMSIWTNQLLFHV